VPKTAQAVEKVVIRVVGGPKQESNTYKSRLNTTKAGFYGPHSGLRGD
jgi:hypothetical protein